MLVLLLQPFKCSQSIKQSLTPRPSSNQTAMEEAKINQVAVMMVPLPAQSHLNTLLQLSGLIASHGIPVHFVGSATHNRQARLRSHGLKPNAFSLIKFHDVATPPIDAPDPDPYAADKTPMHLAPATMAYVGMREAIGLLAQELSQMTTRIVVIYDRMGAEVVRDAVSIPNAESYAFNCLSAFNLFLILWEVMGKPFQLDDDVIKKLPSVREFMSEGSLYFSASTNIEEREGDIHNTIRFIDDVCIGLMSREEISGGKKQWAIKSSGLPITFTKTNESRHECLDWLDKQPPNSVIYVSFGTTTAMTEEEAREIAMGLEQSKQKFVWVVRDADRADIFAGESRRIELPEGFEERVREDGIVVRDWAPQLEILAHRSVGGFMSHCGWNSCLESFAMGVPMAAWPMHSDQPINAIFVTEILRVGVEVREWGRRLEVVEAAAIQNAVERLMASEEGDEMRKRAAVMGAAVKRSMEEGGEGCMEIERFIAHITR